MKQQRQLRRREADETAELPADLPPLLRRLYASRGVRSARELERSVKGMLPWQQLSGIDNAVEILYNAFREGIRIIVVGDFDADGATSTALSVLGMRALGCDNISYLVPNRFEDGYGLSPEVVDQAKARGAQHRHRRQRHFIPRRRSACKDVGDSGDRDRSPPARRHVAGCRSDY